MENDIDSAVARLGNLEREVEKLRKAPKDGWDKVSILTSALIPLAIAGVGLMVSEATEKAQRHESARNLKIAQMELVHDFVDELTSGESGKQKYAVAAMLEVFPPREGPGIVRAVLELEASEEVRSFARRELNLKLTLSRIHAYDNFPRGEATIEGAKKMLRDVGISSLDTTAVEYVSGHVVDDLWITVWPRTYDQSHLYGVRYGSGRDYFGSNETYFAVPHASGGSFGLY